MSKSRKPWFGAGREALLQHLVEYEMGFHDQEGILARIESSLPKSDRVKRHIKRLVRHYFEDRDDVDQWLDSRLKSKAFKAFSDLEKIILRLAVIETRHYSKQLGMPVLIDSWVAIAQRYVDAGFSRLLHAVMGTAYEES